MWEAIRSNRRRSRLLISLMGVILVGLGAAIGAGMAEGLATSGSHEQWRAFEPRSHRARGRLPQYYEYEAIVVDPSAWAVYGAGAALVIWLVLWLTAAAQGDAILLSASGAREIKKQDAPQLWNVVEEMTIAAGLRHMPRVYIIDDPAPNAFAAGYGPEKAAVAVTAGLLRELNRDELQGVIGHEIGHIRNLDIRFMTLAGVMVGAIVIISDAFLRGLRYGAVGRRSGGRDRGRGGGIMLLIALLLAILGPLAAQLLYFACSRRREYLADATSARLTRYPKGLADALEKIARHASLQQEVNRVLAPMYIVNPLGARSASSLFSTHPPIEKRIRILRAMGDRAGLADYEAAYRQVHGGRGCFHPQTLASETTVEARSPYAATETREQRIMRAREAADALSAAARYKVIPCPCGVRLKLPPNSSLRTVRCPRCGRVHQSPAA
jgi:heat shock protein HtpX